MHIPDGFLSPSVFGISWVASVAGIWFSVKQAAKMMKEKMIPLLGVTAAFIFAAQMINFPVAGGTSGHFLGGALAVILLGPWAGALVIAVVLIVQCLLFQDGGLTAYGANVLNMSFFGAVGAYLIYSLIRKAISGNVGILVGAVISAWASVVLASSACAFELGFSGTSPISIALPAMAGVHMVIGMGEAVITFFIISFILKVRPDLIYSKEASI